MCTIGAIRLHTNDILLFKNKDFARASYQDRVISNRDWFGPQGLETFSEDATAPSIYSGISIGANRHGLLACVNHVKSTEPAYSNYDVLVEVALSAAVDVDSAIELLQQHLQKQPSWRGNLILADPSKMAAVEVREQALMYEYGENRILRANHQPLHGEQVSDDGIECSAPRYASAEKQIDRVDSLDALFAMLASHDQGQTGICNHGSLSTVYAYVLQQQGAGTRLHVAHGHPCNNPWISLQVPLGSDWSPSAANAFIAQFPGAMAA